MKNHALLALLISSCATGVAAYDAPVHSVLPLDDNAWRDGPEGLPPGGRFAVISGDPAKAGPFMIRMELPPGYVVPAYRRPSDESIVVLAGSIELGSDTAGEPAALRTLTSGSFVRLPADEIHSLATKSGATVQIFGTGPFRQLSSTLSASSNR